MSTAQTERLATLVRMLGLVVTLFTAPSGGKPVGAIGDGAKVAR